LEKEEGLKNQLAALFRKKKKEFWALRNVDFETKKGEILGIIGGNAAGKSTLLKIIAGIYPATEGSIEVNGNIAPLIELGAAFNPELSGEENIYLTGSIYRIPRKTIREHYEEIVDFSGLRKFINIPVKNYSSGMFIRLAFSIIIFFRPEIVLIDEVFSVGDEVFQQKSFEKILSFKKEGATILLVTHDSNLVTQICDRALILSQGSMSFLGPSEEAVDFYHRLIKSGEGLEADSMLAQPSPPPVESKRWGTKQAEILSVQFVNENGEPKEVFQTGEYFEARISYVSRLEKEKPVFGVAIRTVYKLLIYGPNTLEAGLSEEIAPKGVVRFVIPRLPLLEGDYLFSTAVYDESLKTAYDHHEMMYHFQVPASRGRDFGSVRIHSEWKIEGEVK
jgi:ABC-type polysaccharide/polyol phosphate transport system ATPase subunit